MVWFPGLLMWVRFYCAIFSGHCPFAYSVFNVDAYACAQFGLVTIMENHKITFFSSSGVEKKAVTMGLLFLYKIL